MTKKICRKYTFLFCGFFLPIWRYEAISMQLWVIFNPGTFNSVPQAAECSGPDSDVSPYNCAQLCMCYSRSVAQCKTRDVCVPAPPLPESGPGERGKPTSSGSCLEKRRLHSTDRQLSPVSCLNDGSVLIACLRCGAFCFILAIFKKLILL